MQKKIDPSFFSDPSSTLTELIDIIGIQADIDYVPGSKACRQFTEESSVLGMAINNGRYEMVEYLLQIKELNPYPDKGSPTILLARDLRMFQLLIKYKVGYTKAVKWVFTEGVYYRSSSVLRFIRFLEYSRVSQVNLPYIYNIVLFYAKTYPEFKKDTIDMAFKHVRKEVETILYSLIDALVNSSAVSTELANYLRQEHRNYINRDSDEYLMTICEDLYQLLIGKNYTLAFELLHYNKASPSASLLLAYCYLHKLGCDRDVDKAIVCLSSAFTENNADFNFNSLVILLFEKITAPYNSTNDYLLTLASMYKRSGRFSEAIMQYSLAIENDLSRKCEIFLEIAKCRNDTSEETLRLYDRAADAGSSKALRYLARVYIDGTNTMQPNYKRAIDYCYRLGLQSKYLSKAYSLLNTILRQCESFEITQIVRTRMLELQFNKEIIKKEGGGFIPIQFDKMLLAVIRECCHRDGIKIDNFWLLPSLPAKYVLRNDTERVYSHFLAASRDMYNSIWSTLFGPDTDVMVRAMLYIVAAKLINKSIVPDHDNVMLSDIIRRLTLMFDELLKNTNAEIRLCAEYLDKHFLNEEPPLAAVPDRLCKVLRSNTFPEFLHDRLKEILLWKRVTLDDEIKDALAYAQQSIAVRQQVGVQKFVKFFAPVTQLGCTGAENTTVCRRYSF